MMGNLSVANITVLLNDTASTIGQSNPAVFSSRVKHVMEVKELDISPIPTQISDKPCTDAISSQTPSAVKIPGSLDALLYIVIVLMFYAFSIVILMVKYIRREREEASLRNYYHEFVSREKFKSAQYKNQQFMKRIFSRHGDIDQQTIMSLEDETKCAETSRIAEKHPEENTISRLLLDFEEENRRGKESFTFLGAKAQTCKNTLFGRRFCNKQLCSKCILENVPTIDWDDDRTDKIDSSNQDSLNEIIEVTLHRSALKKSPQSAKIQSCYTENLHGYSPNYAGGDNFFYPIVECEDEKETEINENVHVDSPLWKSTSCQKSQSVQRRASIDEHAIVSSCSLEVSELLANMPPLGLSKSPSNDMDTLDGLSNLDSETENQSLLNYSSSIKLHKDQCISLDSRRNSDGVGDNSRLLNVTGANKSDKLSDRSSLLSCNFSFDDGDEIALSSHFMPNEGHSSSTNSNKNFKKNDICKRNGDDPQIKSFQSADDEDEEEMVRLLNDITVFADQSGVFRNLKYFLRGFYKTDIEDSSEISNLLPKETYFGPGSPKSFKRTDYFSKVGKNGDATHFNQTDSDSLTHEKPRVSSEMISSFGNRWAYTYDDEDGVVSDTDGSSSFGDYCMGDAAESQIIDLNKPLTRRDFDSNVKAGLSRALIGLDDAYLNSYLKPMKANPMMAGYGPARKETKV